jgi:uncharacterized protein (DUF433 family)
MAILGIDHIVSTPETCFGKPRIAGTRTRVKDIVGWYYRAGWSIEQISEQFDLTAGQIFAALSYYADHKAEIDEDMRQDEIFSRDIPDPRTQERRQQIERDLDSSKRQE